MSNYRPMQVLMLVTASLFALPLQADVTLRYKTTVKLNPALPAQMMQQMTKGMESALAPEMTLQLKEGKGYSSFGSFRSVVDFTKQRMTLIDPEKQRYAACTPDDFATEMSKTFANMPPAARAGMAAMKFAVDGRITGRTATIQGIEAEEREIVLTMDGPAMPNMPAGPMMKMVMQFWTAKDSEVMRVPAVRELKGYNLWAMATMNPAASMEKMFNQIPGMGDGMAKFMKEMQSANSVMLRSSASMFMPAMAAMMKQMPAGANPSGMNIDPDSPIMEMNQELSELSSAAVPDSVFRIPEDYKSVTAAELLHDMIMKSQAGMKQ